MSAFAGGKHALGICDRCGVGFKLKELKQETTVYGTPTWRVCRDCWDAPHPQDMSPKVKPDAEALRDPRPDTGLEESRHIPGGVIPVEDL